MHIERGETQKNVNRVVLENILQKFKRTDAIKALDLPCGNKGLLGYIKELYPNSDLYGADIMPPPPIDSIHFIQMDLQRKFELPMEEKYDLITSISGVMMFGNTLSFVENCVAHLKKDGVFIITNDNSSTIIDRLAFLFIGRFRIFKPIYESTETLTQNIPIQELVRLLHQNGLKIERIEYTTFYTKDLIYLPFALVAYAFQRFYLSRYKSAIPDKLKWQKYPFRQLFCKHYVMVCTK
jgi:2-polyprenyl-3-methyl-5-hydroxy-6-metoxy-1,4-benzoquinol methylase